MYNDYDMISQMAMMATMMMENQPANRMER